MPEPTPYVLFVPLLGRTWLNANDRHPWMVKRRLVKSWREAAGIVAMLARVPQLPAGHVVAELLFPDRRRRDPANWAPTAKACVDGLVDARVFVDDNSDIVTGPDMRLGEKVVPAAAGIRLIIHPKEREVW